MKEEVFSIKCFGSNSGKARCFYYFKLFFFCGNMQINNSLERGYLSRKIKSSVLWTTYYLCYFD